LLDTGLFTNIRAKLGRRNFETGSASQTSSSIKKRPVSSKPVSGELRFVFEIQGIICGFLDPPIA
jgi:hypothetical protein